MDFTDAFHLALSQDADEFITFDQQFVATASGKGACTVIQAE